MGTVAVVGVRNGDAVPHQGRCVPFRLLAEVVVVGREDERGREPGMRLGEQWGDRRVGRVAGPDVGPREVRQVSRAPEGPADRRVHGGRGGGEVEGALQQGLRPDSRTSSLAGPERDSRGKGGPRALTHDGQTVTVTPRRAAFAAAQAVTA